MMDSVGTDTCFGMRIERAHRDGMDAWNEGLKMRFMNHSPMRLIVLVAVCIPSIQSCNASPTVPDFYGVGPADEQSTIGEYYRQEAAVFRQRANVMAERAMAYRQLFGEESEWVRGHGRLTSFISRKHESGNVSRTSTNRLQVIMCSLRLLHTNTVVLRNS